MVGRSGADVLVAVVAVVAVALAVTTVAVDVLNTPMLIPPQSEFEPGWVGMVTGLVQVVPGALLLHRLPRHPVAWALVASGLLWLLGGLAASWAAYAIYVAPGTAGASAAFWFSGRLGSIVVLGLPLVLLLFPDGRLPAGRIWRPLSVASLAPTALFPLALTFAPAAVLQHYDGKVLPPELPALALDPVSVALPAGVWDVLLGLVFPFGVLSLVVPFAAIVHRYRLSGGNAACSCAGCCGPASSTCCWSFCSGWYLRPR